MTTLADTDAGNVATAAQRRDRGPQLSEVSLARAWTKVQLPHCDGSVRMNRKLSVAADGMIEPFLSFEASTRSYARTEIALNVREGSHERPNRIAD
jgi:hypothetical protein